MAQEVRTRFAPSPTGSLHIGGLRTALFSYLWARHNNGKFILRVEDTDQTREVKGSLEEIVKTLTDFNITPDEGFYWAEGLKERGEYGPYLQSKRLDIYKKHADELILKGMAYYCFCIPERLTQLREQQQAQKLPPKYDKHCLKLSAEEVKGKLAANEAHVIRLNVPIDQKILFNDLVHGEIEIPTNDIDDQVLLKSDGFPTYHLAVVIDDHLMNITHVIRGEEWIPSTPKHILLYSAFGWELPKYAHAPNILGKTGKKLSKRESDVAVSDFIAKGYLPEALLNFIAFLGWNPKTEQEIFTLNELVKNFSLDKVNKSGAVFDSDKLDWLNGLYIRKMSVGELYNKIEPYLPFEAKNQPKEFILKILELEHERLKKFSEIGERVKYFFEEPKYDSTLLVGPPPRKATAGPPKLDAKAGKKTDPKTIKENLQKLHDFLQSNEPSETAIKKFIVDNGLKNGEVLWPLRVALSGLEASPGPFEIMDAFMALPKGREEILSRIKKAIFVL